MPAEGAFDLLADAFEYPAPGRLAELERKLSAWPDGSAKTAYRAFLEKIQTLPLGEWEELHTRTLDLNPPAAPYVGYQTWGENYARGAFLSAMGRELQVAGVDTGGELPDHLAPILRYLGRTAELLPELVQVLGPALERMTAGLRRVEPDNPYLDLLAAARFQGSTVLSKAPA